MLPVAPPGPTMVSTLTDAHQRYEIASHMNYLIIHLPRHPLGTSRFKSHRPHHLSSELPRSALALGSRVRRWDPSACKAGATCFPCFPLAMPTQECGACSHSAPALTLPGTPLTVCFTAGTALCGALAYVAGGVSPKKLWTHFPWELREDKKIANDKVGSVPRQSDITLCNALLHTLACVPSYHNALHLEVA